MRIKIPFTKKNITIKKRKDWDMLAGDGWISSGISIQIQTILKGREQDCKLCKVVKKRQTSRTKVYTGLDCFCKDCYEREKENYKRFLEFKKN